jgi:hypothetical protein
MAASQVALKYYWHEQCPAIALFEIKHVTLQHLKESVN